MDEAVVLIMAMRNSNIPKFLIEDAALFTAIVSDLFPATDVPEHVSTGLSCGCLSMLMTVLIPMHGVWCCMCSMPVHYPVNLLLVILGLNHMAERTRSKPCAWCL